MGKKRRRSSRSQSVVAARSSSGKGGGVGALVEQVGRNSELVAVIAGLFHVIGFLGVALSPLLFRALQQPTAFGQPGESAPPADFSSEPGSGLLLGYGVFTLVVFAVLGWAIRRKGLSECRFAVFLVGPGALYMIYGVYLLVTRIGN